MSLLSRIRRLLRNLTGRAAVERELDDELRAYVDLLTTENVKAGATPEEARRAALLKVGGFEHVKDQVRDERPGSPCVSPRRDAIRQLANR